MPGFHKRREYKYEGTVESVYLTDGMTIELIADGIHLPSTILKLAYKLKGVEHTCLVTDALSCAATEGKEINDPRYIIEDGVCKLADRSSLAGSIATMDVLVRTMVKAGIPLGDALRMASETPARIMGVYARKGSLQKDKDADILIYNSTIEGELYSVDELLAKSTLFSDFKAVKEGNVYCTGSNFFQESTGTCDFIEDLHKVLVDETDDNYRFLKHVR